MTMKTAKTDSAHIVDYVIRPMRQRFASVGTGIL